MFMVSWVQELALQSNDMNDEHHALLNKLNDLLIALSSPDRTRIVMACNVLAVEARAHFDSEEAQMREAGYPALEQHREQHEELQRNLSHLLFTANSGAGFLSSTYPYSFLQLWFVPHLTYADRKAADFLAANAAAAQGNSDSGRC
jgi:hemerythrin